MEGFKIVSLRTLVRDEDADEVMDGHLQMAEFDGSIGAYLKIEELTPDDESVWAEILEDAKS